MFSCCQVIHRKNIARENVKITSKYIMKKAENIGRRVANLPRNYGIRAIKKMQKKKGVGEIMERT
jgi:hypothetical protein